MPETKQATIAAPPLGQQSAALNAAQAGRTPAPPWPSAAPNAAQAPAPVPLPPREILSPLPALPPAGAPAPAPGQPQQPAWQRPITRLGGMDGSFRMMEGGGLHHLASLMSGRDEMKNPAPGTVIPGQMWS